LKKYGLSDKKISQEDLTKWDKETKRKKSKPSKIAEEIEIDLDQENQEPNLENEENQPVNKRSSKKRKK
jgi:hypothetical protein